MPVPNFMTCRLGACAVPDQGLGDIKPWSAGYDSACNGCGGIGGAQDECILHYVRTSGQTNRAVCLDKNNNGAAAAVVVRVGLCVTGLWSL